jgi:hypothetical protein
MDHRPAGSRPPERPFQVPLEVPLLQVWIYFREEHMGPPGREEKGTTDDEVSKRAGQVQLNGKELLNELGVPCSGNRPFKL